MARAAEEVSAPPAKEPLVVEASDATVATPSKSIDKIISYLKLRTI